MKTVTIILFIYDETLDYFIYLDNILKRIDMKYKNTYKFEYYLYNLTSNDNLKKKLNLFFKNLNIEFYSEKLLVDKEFRSRSQYMSFLKNRLKVKTESLNSDFCVLIDFGIVFTEDLINNLIENLILETESVGIVPLKICLSKNNIDNKNIQFIKKNKSNFIIKNIIDMNSFYSGLIIMESSVFNIINWDEFTELECENYSLYKKILDIGYIILNNNSFCTKTDENYYEKEKKLKNLTINKIL